MTYPVSVQILISIILITIDGHDRCLAHIVNLATQVLILTRSKANYYNPYNIDEHSPDFDANERDELGLVRAISVKVCKHLVFEWINTHIWQRHGPPHSGRSYSDQFKLVKELHNQYNYWLI